jgi:N-acetylmuramoyl-L-alanine amidase
MEGPPVDRSPRRLRRWPLVAPLGLVTTVLVTSQLAGGPPPAGAPPTPAGIVRVAEAAGEPATPAPAPSAMATALAVADAPEPELEATSTAAPAVAVAATATPVLASPTATSAPVIATAPPAPPAGPPRIGLQVGHWRIEELPDELSRLRGASGGSGGGMREVDLNLAVTERLAGRLRERGFTVDVLPATVPPGYRADLFLAIHADASASASPRGFKLARSRWSRLPTTDDALVRTLTEEYGRVTGLPWSDAITRNMTGYYSFNNRRRANAIDKSTPAAIIEMGYLTNPADRQLLVGQMDVVVAGIERGVTRFLDERPPLAEREQPATVGLTIVIGEGGAVARASPNADAPALATLEAGRRQEAPEIAGEWFGIWVTEVNGPGWVHRSQATLITIQLP